MILGPTLEASRGHRLCYAASYAALAALLSRHLEYSKHSAVQVDYMPLVEMDPDELKQLLTDVRSWVAGVSEYVRKNV